MKLTKYIAATLLATSGILVAANHIVGGAHTEKTTDKEKRNLGESFYAGLQQVKPSVYPRMTLDGSADGIPYGLRLSGIDDKKVSLTWNTPEPTDGYFEDFEDHDDFAVNSAGAIGWSYVDADNKNTYSWSATQFKNQGQKMAYIIMNPSATTPSVEANPNYVPTSGKKMLVTMCSIDAQNNDWIISPELNFKQDFKFSFNARSYRTDGISPERMKVGYSTGGKSLSSFTFVTPSPYQELPAEWKLYEYVIPKEAKYVCINCVSDDAFMMLIDDIYIGTNEVRPGIKGNTLLRSAGDSFGKAKQTTATGDKRLTGFNVYRDGKKANSTLIKEIRYTDTADTYSSHVYTVTAVYSDGTESAQSQPITVDVIDPSLIPFDEDFDNWYMDPQKWSTPANPAGVDNLWGIDYYTYGLIDPCATYGYSALKDFDQSLVSRSLRTLNRENTYLRFETRLEVWKIYPDETCYLAVEISNDNGKTWETIDTYSNRNGEEPWTVRLYSLKDYIKSDYFKLRWRCYGPTAAHLDYWYVDDIKVWNANFGKLRLNVSSSDGVVKGTEVKLVGNKGGKYTATTDASGNIAIGQIEADTYAVSIEQNGYNVYQGSLIVEDDKTTDTSIHLTRPVLTVSSDKVAAELSVEEKAQRQFTVRNDGDGPMTWRMDYRPAKQSGKALDFEVRKTWKGSGDLQTSIAFDGEYYYTTSWYYLGEFWKYDREGNLIEQFRIPDMYYKLYDLAYDGRYFYGSDYSNRIFQLDFENKRIAGIIEITSAPELQITHIAYNPNNDRFYVGGWNTLCEVRRNGRTSSMAAAFDPDQGHYIYGSAYDNVTPGGPYLWLAAEETYNDFMLDQAVIYQYNLSTKKFTGVRKSLSDLPGYVFGNAMTGINYLCGLEGTVDAESGKFTLIGMLQQSPSFFFEYNVGETDTWLDYNPRKATLMPGESTTVNVDFDARYAEVGKSYSIDMPIVTIPELDKKSITLSFTATKASTTPRPKNLTAEQDISNVVLTWTKPDANPTSYNIYRNGTKIATTTEPSYTDAMVIRGTYSYEVSAMYGDVESVRSDAVEHVVKVGAPFYTPLDFNATISLNKNVTLEWKNPLFHIFENKDLSWSSCIHADQVGATSGGTFFAGSLWSADDMTLYRNKKITSASIRIVNPVNYLALCIFKDGERILRKQYTDPINYGEMTTVTLDEPITIEPGSDYIIAFQVDHAEGMQPFSIDDKPTVEGKGNLLSVDAEYWFPATQMAIDGNFCIKFHVDADSTTTERSPITYSVYRNGEKIATLPPVPVASLLDLISGPVTFSDELTEPGTYNYTVTSAYNLISGDYAESQPTEPVSVEVKEIKDRVAPAELQTSVIHNRDLTLGWGYPVNGKQSFPVDILPRVTTTKADYPVYVSSFLANGTEMAVASDGKFIYTSVYSEDGRVNKYDMQGNLLEFFYFKELEGIRNLTYDGADFWAADGNTYIYKVDMDEHKVKEQFNISEYARHLTYIPDLDEGRGGFEVGDWETSIYVNRRGAKIGDGPSYNGAAGTAYFNGKIYAFEQGNANSHTIGIYDYEKRSRIGEIDLENYTGLNAVMTAVAGGMSVITTTEGQKFLAVMTQNTQAVSEVIFFDVASMPTVAGYKIYRDGNAIANVPTNLTDGSVSAQRVFKEKVYDEGTHKYQVQTVYIDGSTSELSEPIEVVILPMGTADAPTDVQAEATIYGYDVAVSFADPKLGSDVAVFQDFEKQQPGQPVSIADWQNTGNLWTATDLHYHGNVGIKAERNSNADLVIPVGSNRWIGFFARMQTSAATTGSDGAPTAPLYVYTSVEGTNPEDFILLDEFNVPEQWQSMSLALPAGTRYVSIRHASGDAVVVDAIRLNETEPQSSVWGYDILRDGTQINDQPVEDVSFIDHNLKPGVYSYQVRQHSVTSAVSPLSKEVTLNLDYSNGGQAPEHLRITNYNSSEVGLAWNAPALGNAINLKWHTGNSYDAAGLPSGGSFFAAVRWSAADLANYAHLSLSEVEVYINQIPDALFLLVYQGSNLVRRQYVPQLKQYSFNTIRLDEPLPIDATKELRVVIYVEHNEITVPLGYDEGPARTGYGNLYSNDGVTYTTTDNEDTGIYANWNITIGLKPYADTQKGKRLSQPVEDAATSSRQFPMTIKDAATVTDGSSWSSVSGISATVTEASASVATPLLSKAAGIRATSAVNTFEGYNIYANNELVNATPIFQTSYTDYTNYTIFPYVQFKVSAVYSQLGEVFSNVVVLDTNSADGIETITGSTFSVAVEGSTVSIIGAREGSQYRILNAAGQQYVSGTITSGHVEVPLTVPAGIYVVKVDAENIKIKL